MTPSRDGATMPPSPPDDHETLGQRCREDPRGVFARRDCRFCCYRRRRHNERWQQRWRRHRGGGWSERHGSCTVAAVVLPREECGKKMGAAGFRQGEVWAARVRGIEGGSNGDGEHAKDGTGPNVEHSKVPVQRPYPGLRQLPGPPPPAHHRVALWYSTRLPKLLQRALG